MHLNHLRGSVILSRIYKTHTISKTSVTRCPSDIYPPHNFSWVVENQLAAMACPACMENLEYLAKIGIRHLISLSGEKLPPIKQYKNINWTLIPIEEFEAPSINDITKFIDICNNCLATNQAVGVHCRQGRGRTGVMAACFLLKFKNLAPDRAITSLRLQRPGSIETYDQEKAVSRYYDYLRNTQS